MPVVFHLLSEEGEGLPLARLAVPGQSLDDPVGMAQVDLVGVLPVLCRLAELFQPLPASRLVPREHPQPFGERRAQVGEELAGVQDR